MLSSKSITMILLKSWCVQTIQRAEETLIHCTTPYQLGLRLEIILKWKSDFSINKRYKFWFYFFLNNGLSIAFGSQFSLITVCFLCQYINKTGFRACVKELFVQQHDPLSVSYAVLPGEKALKLRYDVTQHTDNWLWNYLQWLTGFFWHIATANYKLLLK